MRSVGGPFGRLSPPLHVLRTVRYLIVRLVEDDIITTVLVWYVNEERQATALQWVPCRDLTKKGRCSVTYRGSRRGGLIHHGVLEMGDVDMSVWSLSRLAFLLPSPVSNILLKGYLKLGCYGDFMSWPPIDGREISQGVWKSLKSGNGSREKFETWRGERGFFVLSDSIFLLSKLWFWFLYRI